MHWTRAFDHLSRKLCFSGSPSSVIINHRLSREIRLPQPWEAPLHIGLSGTGFLPSAHKPVILRECPGKGLPKASSLFPLEDGQRNQPFIPSLLVPGLPSLGPGYTFSLSHNLPWPFLAFTYYKCPEQMKMLLRVIRNVVMMVEKHRKDHSDSRVYRFWDCVRRTQTCPTNPRAPLGSAVYSRLCRKVGTEGNSGCSDFHHEAFFFFWKP